MKKHILKSIALLAIVASLSGCGKTEEAQSCGTNIPEQASGIGTINGEKTTDTSEESTNTTEETTDDNGIKNKTDVDWESYLGVMNIPTDIGIQAINGKAEQTVIMNGNNIAFTVKRDLPESYLKEEVTAEEITGKEPTAPVEFTFYVIDNKDVYLHMVYGKQNETIAKHSEIGETLPSLLSDLVVESDYISNIELILLEFLREEEIDGEIYGVYDALARDNNEIEDELSIRDTSNDPKETKAEVYLTKDIKPYIVKVKENSVEYTLLCDEKVELPDLDWEEEDSEVLDEYISERVIFMVFYDNFNEEVDSIITEEEAIDPEIYY